MTRSAFLIAALQLSLVALPRTGRADPPPAAEVVIHDHGNKTHVTGAPADEIVRLCVDLVRQSDDQGFGPGTGQWQEVRANEVAVEVRFEQPQEMELKFTNERARPQTLLVPLTGSFTAPNGNNARVMAGRLARRSDYPYLGFEMVNGSDEYGFQYYTTYNRLDGLDDLRQAVAKLGVEAPRQPQPETTPDRSPMVIPPLEKRETK